MASTRPGRIGLSVAGWVHDIAAKTCLFDVEIVDLAEVDLPLFNEPEHPRFSRYVHRHTWAWSETVSRGDAFLIVTPEYNHSFNAALKNALDYLWQEWHGKPVGLIGYGGGNGGKYACAAVLPVLEHIGMVVVTPFVTIAGVAKGEVSQVLGADSHYGHEIARMVENLSRELKLSEVPS